MRKQAEDYYAKRDRLGAAILASDKSFEAIGDIMRGAGGMFFWRMDEADGTYPVPEWHMYLRRWRNGCRDCFKILNDEGGK